MDTQRRISQNPSSQVIENTRWRSDRLRFIIDLVKTDDRGTWVFYHNEDTGQTYNCLIDAFTARFNRDHSYE